MSDKRWYLVSYDVRDPKRWRQVYKIMKGSGDHLQYSLFRCWLTESQMAALRWELEKCLAKEDDLMFIHLCPSCAARVDVRGEPNASWSQPRKRVEIL